MKLTLIDESRIETLGKGTAGLASATQLIEYTGSSLAMISNTSLASLNYIPLEPLQDLKSSQRKKEKPKTKSEGFRENLRISMRFNAEILKDLARY